MAEAVIVDSVRTGLAKSFRGGFNQTRADDMTAHIKSALTNNQLTLSIKNKQLILGTWQGLYLFEHRLEKHTRKISHHFIGK